jgi:hypothetical protein
MVRATALLDMAFTAMPVKLLAPRMACTAKVKVLMALEFSAGIFARAVQVFMDMVLRMACMVEVTPQ